MTTEIKVSEGGLVKLQEITEKEDVKSGLPFTAEKTKLNQILAEILSSQKAAPLDVYDNVKVIKEERICVPSFLFYCNASADFSYEVGNRRSTSYSNDLGDRVEEVTKSWTEYESQTHREATSYTAIACGNKDCAQLIQDLYVDFDANQLINVEDLNLPADIKSVKYDMPQAAAFNDFVQPQIEEMLKQKAAANLSNKNVVNLAMHGCNVQKDEIIKIFLGFYHIIYEYNGKEYSVYITANGENYVYNDPPIDENRKKQIEEKEASIRGLSYPSTGYKALGWLTIVCIVLMFVIKSDTVGIIAFLVSLISLVLWIIFKVKYHRADNKRRNTENMMQSELNDFCDEPKKEMEKFLQSGKIISGL